MTMIGQTEKRKATKRVGIFGGSYFTQTASTEFPVSGQQPNRDIYVGGKLASRSVTGSFGGFRTGNVGYRFNIAWG
jgi:hypothetical protein